MSPLEIVCIVILSFALGFWLTRFFPYSDEPDDEFTDMAA